MERPPSGTVVAIHLEKEYSRGRTLVRAIDGIDLAVREGEFVSVMGPSGSGKSTLLLLLGGLERHPSSTAPGHQIQMSAARGCCPAVARSSLDRSATLRRAIRARLPRAWRRRTARPVMPKARSSSVVDSGTRFHTPGSTLTCEVELCGVIDGRQASTSRYQKTDGTP